MDPSEHVLHDVTRVGDQFGGHLFEPSVRDAKQHPLVAGVQFAEGVVVPLLVESHQFIVSLVPHGTFLVVKKGHITANSGRLSTVVFATAAWAVTG